MVEDVLALIHNINFLDIRTLYAVAIIVFTSLSGKLIAKIVFPRTLSFLRAHKFANSVIVTQAIKEYFSFWTLIMGFYLALFVYPISEKHIAVAHRIIVALTIISITLLLVKVSGIFLNYYSKRKTGSFQNISLPDNISKIVIFIIGLLVALQTLGLSITPLLTALGVGGLAVALALQDTLSNFFAGFHILASHQVAPGDYIKLGITDEEGYVIDITWRNTTIRSLKNNIHVIPNSKMASTIITNYYQPQKEMSVLIDVGVSYDSNLEKVEAVTIAAAKETLQNVNGGVKTFDPFIRYHTFDDFSIKFTVILRVQEFVDQYLVKHEFVKNLHKYYKEENITIPFPIRTIYNKS